jgi:hypothetical protein
MNILKPTLIVLLAACSLLGCKTNNANNQKGSNSAGDLLSPDVVQVYYFHNTKRCATCNAVEDETRMALDLFYQDELESGNIEFTALNLEEEEGERMAELLQVSGQTLLLVRGEARVNLTNEGFMNARTNPTGFHEILISQIDKLL